MGYLLHLLGQKNKGVVHPEPKSAIVPGVLWSKCLSTCDIFLHLGAFPSFFFENLRYPNPFLEKFVVPNPVLNKFLVPNVQIATFTELNEKFLGEEEGFFISIDY